jgi:hypothetical protein
MKATKTFKIGEYAVGGIVIVNIIGKAIFINFADWNSKETLLTGSTTSDNLNSRYIISEFLNENTSYHWADTILKWIESKVTLKNEFNY